MSDLLTEVFNYWQARFNVLTEAWRSGNNDAVLKATHDFIRANDDAPAKAKLQIIAELQAEVERLKSASREVADHSLAMSSQNFILREQCDQLKSWEVATRELIGSLFDATAHGDSGHRAW